MKTLTLSSETANAYQATNKLVCDVITKNLTLAGNKIPPDMKGWIEQALVEFRILAPRIQTGTIVLDKQDLVTIATLLKVFLIFAEADSNTGHLSPTIALIAVLAADGLREEFLS